MEIKCIRCNEKHEEKDMPLGMCEDCVDVMQNTTLEEQLEEIGIY